MTAYTPHGSPTAPRFLWPLVAAGAAWLLLVTVALMARPLLPVDETRYLAVAWDMWLSGDLLVPHLNGEAYSHKPPLLFWLINGVWALFGVNDWSGRLVAPAFALATLPLTYLLGRLIWPDDRFARAYGPLVLAGTATWVMFATLTYFDMMIGFFTVLGMVGCWCVVRAKPRLGWGVVALAIGLGVLAKGPVILVHVLPPLVLAPLWQGRQALPGITWKRWYLGLVLATVGGAAIALAWALPAASAGGEDYGNAILWGQTAGRVANSFAHGQPWWFYGAVLVPMLLPWSFWPSFWRSARAARAEKADPGFRFLLVWFIGVTVILSFVSGKQVHYLLPSVPAVALLVARLLGRAEERPSRIDGLPLGVVLAVLGLGVLLLPLIKHGVVLDPELAALSNWWGLGFLALGGGLLFWRPWVAGWRLAGQSGAIVAVLVLVHLIAAPYLAAFHNLKPTAQWIALAQDRGLPVANISKYHGQYHFLGRLKAPIDSVWEHDIGPWLDSHDTGKVIIYYDGAVPDPLPEFLQPYRSRTIVVRDIDQLHANPDLVIR
ncbi:MAG: ArnT family glycosyltransferase [Rhodospirillales bacterium]